MQRRRYHVILSILVLIALGYGLTKVGLPVRFLPNRSISQDLSPYFELDGGPERTGRGFPQREIIDLASEFPGIVYNQGSNDVKEVALTFDDGPDTDTTVQILDILKKHNIKATFFIIGKRAEADRVVLERMITEGHIIGNHTWSHPNLMKLDKETLVKELMAVEELVLEVAGYRTSLFRSPYGSLKRENVKQIADLDYKIIAWNVDSLDWKSLTGEQVRTNILENVKNGSIILQHSAGGPGEDLSGTVEALPTIITTLQKDGYKFVTVPKLLNIPYTKD